MYLIICQLIDVTVRFIVSATPETVIANMVGHTNQSLTRC